MDTPESCADYGTEEKLIKTTSKAHRETFSQFEPYASYVARSDRLREFVTLTSISYKLAEQMLFSTVPERLSDVMLNIPAPSTWSYSMADARPQSITITAAWLRYSEYAKREGLTVAEVMTLAKSGQLGAIAAHPSDGAPVILWPPANRRGEGFGVLEPGYYRIQAKEEITVQAEVEVNFDLSDPNELSAARRLYLSLAHSLGDPGEVNPRAEEILFRASYLLQWTSFEIFLREVVEYLLMKHPQSIVLSAGRKASISYSELLDMSGQLTSVDELRQALIDLEVQRLRAGGRSVHGLINFLKSAFKFEHDPYKAWYVIKGRRREVGYERLVEVKDRRNALVHESERTDYRGVGAAPVTDDEYSEMELILRSVAYSIAADTCHENYQAPRLDGSSEAE